MNWIDANLAPGFGLGAVFVGAGALVTALLLYASAFPCPGLGANGLVCGTGWSAATLWEIGGAFVTAYVVAYFLAVRVLFVRQVGVSSYGLVLCTGFGTPVIPWNAVSLPPDVAGRNRVTLRFRNTEATWRTPRRLVVPVDVAKAILSSRQELEVGPSSGNRPQP
jgi:hypothetical protein